LMGQKFLTARGGGSSGLITDAGPEERSTGGLGPCALGGYDADSFSKTRHACLEFTHRASPNFCNHRSDLDLHRYHTRDIKIEIFAPHPRQDKMSPYDLRALDNVSHRPQDNKPFNPEHLLPTQRKKAFAVRLHRGHLILAVGAACRCTRPNIGRKARYVVRADGLECFHTIQTRRRRPHTPRQTLGAMQHKTLCRCLSNDGSSITPRMTVARLLA
jgi:hypothetical protein